MFPELVVLAYPNNQFGMQEPFNPNKPEELYNGIRYVRPGDNFEPKVDYFFEKCDVNGRNQLPIYSFLKTYCGPTFTQFADTSKLFYEPLRLGDIAWNFEKFLIDRNGRPYTRYHPHMKNTTRLAKDIERVLSKQYPVYVPTEYHINTNTPGSDELHVQTNTPGSDELHVQTNTPGSDEQTNTLGSDELHVQTNTPGPR